MYIYIINIVMNNYYSFGFFFASSLYLFDPYDYKKCMGSIISVVFVWLAVVHPSVPLAWQKL